MVLGIPNNFCLLYNKMMIKQIYIYIKKRLSASLLDYKGRIINMSTKLLLWVKIIKLNFFYLLKRVTVYVKNLLCIMEGAFDVILLQKKMKKALKVKKRRGSFRMFIAYNMSYLPYGYLIAGIIFLIDFILRRLWFSYDEYFYTTYASYLNTWETQLNAWYMLITSWKWFKNSLRFIWFEWVYPYDASVFYRLRIPYITINLVRKDMKALLKQRYDMDIAGEYHLRGWYNTKIFRRKIRTRIILRRWDFKSMRLQERLWLKLKRTVSLLNPWLGRQLYKKKRIYHNGWFYKLIKPFFRKDRLFHEVDPGPSEEEMLAKTRQLRYEYYGRDLEFLIKWTRPLLRAQIKWFANGTVQIVDFLRADGWVTPDIARDEDNERAPWATEDQMHLWHDMEGTQPFERQIDDHIIRKTYDGWYWADTDHTFTKRITNERTMKRGIRQNFRTIINYFAWYGFSRSFMDLFPSADYLSYTTNTMNPVFLYFVESDYFWDLAIYGTWIYAFAYLLLYFKLSINMQNYEKGLIGVYKNVSSIIPKYDILRLNYLERECMPNLRTHGHHYRYLIHVNRMNYLTSVPMSYYLPTTGYNDEHPFDETEFYFEGLHFYKWLDDASKILIYNTIKYWENLTYHYEQFIIQSSYMDTHFFNCYEENDTFTTAYPKGYKTGRKLSIKQGAKKSSLFPGFNYSSLNARMWRDMSPSTAQLRFFPTNIDMRDRMAQFTGIADIEGLPGDILARIDTSQYDTMFDVAENTLNTWFSSFAPSSWRSLRRTINAKRNLIWERRGFALYGYDYNYSYAKIYDYERDTALIKAVQNNLISYCAYDIPRKEYIYMIKEHRQQVTIAKMYYTKVIKYNSSMSMPFGPYNSVRFLNTDMDYFSTFNNRYQVRKFDKYRRGSYRTYVRQYLHPSYLEIELINENIDNKIQYVEELCDLCNGTYDRYIHARTSITNIKDIMPIYYETVANLKRSIYFKMYEGSYDRRKCAKSKHKYNNDQIQFYLKKQKTKDDKSYLEMIMITEAKRKEVKWQKKLQKKQRPLLSRRTLTPSSLSKNMFKRIRRIVNKTAEEHLKNGSGKMYEKSHE